MSPAPYQKYLDQFNALDDVQKMIGTAVALVAVAVLYLISTRPSGKPSLKKDDWQKYKLIDKIVVSPNTATYRFAIPNRGILGLPIGQHVSVSATINDKLVQRSYTPTSSDDDKGYFELLIKSYPTGNISKYFGELKVGDYVDFKGPKGQMVYTPNMSDQIGMIAGGTGITPMLQIIRAVLKNPSDKTKLSLIYANVKPQDILLKKSLDALAEKHADQFKLYYVLNEPPKEWNGGAGFVTREMIEEHLPKAYKRNKILLCGPPPMINAMKKSLKELNFDEPRTISKKEDQVFCF
ncbi:BZ3500_MvSof-1268-A1-R1_Chr9g10761 [Microbotryum saponariae]|uniref:NADH-cytochrome b5 reductase n=1 Tax=Microbotryum saponariae TaxID=289078 RepID=A0A2X0LNE8_9BASI|nr:BZ3501_MvSof-1269-A2-R1_Chr9g10509 [Microbotryum saponariae]SDA00643.1 BZ3500_MvSof-1268-A1-R1_Chr9g10761 [Microbotryum saponariae]